MARYDMGPIAVTLTVDTAAYTNGDLLSQAVEVPGLSTDNQPVYINSLTVTDFDDQAGEFDVVVFDRNPGDLGALNATMALSDAVCEYIQAVISIDSTHYVDLGAQQIGQPEFYTRKVRPHDGGTSVWIAGVSQDQKTYASGRLLLHVGAVRVE